MSRVNLIDNPSFKVGTAGWSVLASSTLARTTSDGFFGDTCLEVTKAASNNSGTVWASATVAPSTIYSASLYVKVPLGEQTSALAMYVDWYNSLAVLISSSAGALTTVTDADGWIRLGVTATAPSTAISARVRVVQPTAGTAGEKFLVDAALLEQSSYIGQYFDDLTQDQEKTAVNNALRPVPYPEITGMQLNADISINGLVLNTIDEDNILWVCTGLAGWWGQAPVEIQDIPRGLGDGSYDVVGRYAARQIELSGSIIPPSPEYIDAARDKLVRAIDLVRKNAWLLADESPVKGAVVRLSGQPSMEVVNPRGRIDFNIGLRAPNPIKYHWNAADVEGYTRASVAANNETTITNIGNTDVAVVFTLTGPFSADTIIRNETTGQSMLVTTTLGSAGLTIGSVTNAFRETVNGVVYATISMSSNYPIAIGDTVTVASVGNSFNGTFEVYNVYTTSSATKDIVYINTGGAPFASAPATGTVTLTNAETLTIDTYDRNVFLNNNTVGSRENLETLVEWITLRPGTNVISIEDGGAATAGVLEVKYRSGWIG